MVTTDFPVAGARTAFWPVLAGASPYGVTTCVIADPSVQSGAVPEMLHWIAAELNAAAADEVAHPADAYVTAYNMLCSDSYFLGLHSLSTRMAKHASQCSSFSVDRCWLLSEQLMILVALWQTAIHHRIGVTTDPMTLTADTTDILLLPVASQLLGSRVVAKSAYVEGSLPGVCAYKMPVMSITSVKADRAPLASRRDFGSAIFKLKTILSWNRALEKVAEAAKSSLNSQRVHGFSVPIHTLIVNDCDAYEPLLEDRLDKQNSDLCSRMKKATQSSIIVSCDDSRCSDTRVVDTAANQRSGSARRNTETWPATGDEVIPLSDKPSVDQSGYDVSEGCAFSLGAHQGVSFSRDNLHSVFWGKRKPRTFGPH